MNQYQIVLVNLDPTQGVEIKKTRPCVIISPDEMNQHLKTLVVAPMTTTSKPYPTRVVVTHNKKKGWVVLDQIRSIDKSRVIKKYKRLSDNEISQIKSVLRETYVD